MDGIQRQSRLKRSPTPSIETNAIKAPPRHRPFNPPSRPHRMRRMVEVRGVEPLSEMESPKLLRVYAAFDLGCGTPTTGLIRTHPHDSAPCSEQEDPPAAWPDRLCLPAHRTSAGRHCGLYLGGKSVIVVRNYSFSRFLRGQRESTTRDLTSTHPVETGSPPLGSTRILYQIFMPHAPSCRHSSAPS